MCGCCYQKKGLRMIIALDYDNTYTSDPHCFDRIIEMFETCGHEVICVTWRFDNDHERILNRVGMHSGIKVFYTGRQQKRNFMQSLGIMVDIWVDDMPEAIV